MSQWCIVYLKTCCNEKAFCLCGTLAKTVLLRSNHEVTSEKPELRESIQVPVLFKNVDLEPAVWFSKSRCLLPMSDDLGLYGKEKELAPTSYLPPYNNK